MSRNISPGPFYFSNREVSIRRSTDNRRGSTRRAKPKSVWQPTRRPVIMIRIGPKCSLFDGALGGAEPHIPRACQSSRLQQSGTVLTLDTKSFVMFSLTSRHQRNNIAAMLLDKQRGSRWRLGFTDLRSGWLHRSAWALPDGRGDEVRQALPSHLLGEIAVAAFVILLAGGIASAESDNFERLGLIVGVGGTVAIPTDLENRIHVTNGPAVSGFDVDPAPGYALRAGYRFHPNFAVELRFEGLNEIDVSVKDARRPVGENRGTSTVAQISGWTVTADAKAYLLTGRVEPFVVVGVGAIDINVENKSDPIALVTVNLEDREGTEFAGRVGGGIDFHLTDRFALVFAASYVLPAGNLERYEYVSFDWGIQYRFGGAR
jgi:opacity protein-like surface antigen